MKSERKISDLSVAIAIVARIIVVFVGGAGFLFGQAFFGMFEWSAKAAGLGGLAVALLSGLPAKLGNWPRMATLLAGIISLFGVGFDAVDYYVNLNTPGNYYAWFLTAPFVISVVFLIWYAGAKSARD